MDSPASPTAQFVAAGHVALSTPGEPVATGARVVLTADGRLGLALPSSTDEVRRLAPEGRVVVQPSDRRGRVVAGSAPLEVDAEVLRSGALFDELRGRLRETHGWRARLDARHADAVVLVTLAEPPGPDR